MDVLGRPQSGGQKRTPSVAIIDDRWMKQLPKRSGETLFEIVLRRHEVKSTLKSSNRPLEDWGKFLGDVLSGTAILDRFLHHSEVIQITGKSYRLATREERKGDQNARRVAVRQLDRSATPKVTTSTPTTSNQPVGNF